MARKNISEEVLLARIIFAKDAQMDYFLWSLAVLLVLSGIAGMILPALPGSPLLFAGLVCAAWAEDFAYVHQNRDRFI